MSEPDDIPQDLINKAEAFWEDLVNANPGRDAETKAIARALMAERAQQSERDAVIAERSVWDAVPNLTVTYAWAAARIARAIRS